MQLCGVDNGCVTKLIKSWQVVLTDKMDYSGISLQCFFFVK